MRTIVLSFEQFPACSLGCYGEWNISTPEFDALASQSLLFENYFVSPQGPSLLHQLHAGHPELTLISGREESTHESIRSVASLAAGEVPTLVRLGEWFPARKNSLLFVECLPEIPWMRELVSLASRWPVLDPVETGTSFPLALCTSEQPAGNSGKEQPEVRLDDPSSLTMCRTWPAWKQRLLAHAAHVQRCDDLLSRWLELLEQVLEPEDLLVLTAATGDLRRIPDERPDWLKSLAEPIVHLPLIVHRVESGQQNRLPELLTPAAAARFILCPDALSIPSGKEDATAIECHSKLAAGRRSPEWLFVEELRSDDATSITEVTETDVHLYAKPEDIWEVHDLARQYPELIEQYRQRTGLFTSGR